MTDPATGVWPIINAYLGGSEPFETAAASLATIFYESEQELASRDQRSPTDKKVSARLLWIPLESVAKKDRPKVTKLLERAFELSESFGGEAV